MKKILILLLIVFSACILAGCSTPTTGPVRKSSIESTTTKAVDTDKRVVIEEEPIEEKNPLLEEIFLVYCTYVRKGRYSVVDIVADDFFVKSIWQPHYDDISDRPEDGSCHVKQINSIEECMQKLQLAIEIPRSIKYNDGEVILKFVASDNTNYYRSFDLLNMDDVVVGGEYIYYIASNKILSDKVASIPDHTIGHKVGLKYKDVLVIPTKLYNDLLQLKFGF